MLSMGHLRLTQYYKNNVGSIHDPHTGILENQEAKAYTVKNSNWIVQKSNQSILKEINLEYSLEEMMLKLKFQFFGHLIRRADSLEKTLMLGKIEGRRRRGVAEEEMVGWHHWLNGHEFEHAPGDREAWCATVHGVAESQRNWATEQQGAKTGAEGRSCACKKEKKISDNS